MQQKRCILRIIEYLYIIKQQQKPTKMTTLETLKAELNQAKINVKFAQSIEIIFNAFDNKEAYSYNWYKDHVVTIFGNDILMFAKLKVTYSSVKQYEEMSEGKGEDVKELKKAVKFVESNKDTNLLCELFASRYR